MADDLDVRRPRTEDFPGVLQCLRAYNLHLLGHGPHVDPDMPDGAILEVRNEVSHIDLDDRSWIALRRDKVLGFCCWDWIDRSAKIAKTVLISVLSDARSLGVGSLLQRRRLEEMRENGATEVHTWSDDPGAIQWYQKTFGYEVLAHEPTRHCLHRFHHRGQDLGWAIHRGIKDRDMLAHLRLRLSPPF